MLKYSSEKLNKHKYVYHTTKHNYKYPFVNPNYSAPGGYGGDNYGGGFYTTDDKEVLEGYKKQLTNPIVRKQKLPKGTTILDYDNLNETWQNIIINFIKENFKQLNYKESKIKNTIQGILGCFSLRLEDNITYRIFNQLNPFLLKKGIDVVKYSPGIFVQQKFKGYNYLILNKNILNLSDDSQKNYIKNNNFDDDADLLYNVSLEKLETIKQFYPKLYEKIKKNNYSINIKSSVLENDFEELEKLTNQGHLSEIANIITLTNNNKFYYYLLNKYGTLKTYNILTKSLYLDQYINLMPEEIKKIRNSVIKQKQEEMISHATDNDYLLTINDFVKKYPSYAQEIYNAANDMIKASILTLAPINDTNMLEIITNTKSAFTVVKILFKQEFTLTTQQKEELFNFYKNDETMTSNLKHIFLRT